MTGVCHSLHAKASAAGAASYDGKLRSLALGLAGFARARKFTDHCKHETFRKISLSGAWKTTNLARHVQARSLFPSTDKRNLPARSSRGADLATGVVRTTRILERRDTAIALLHAAPDGCQPGAYAGYKRVLTDKAAAT